MFTEQLQLIEALNPVYNALTTVFDVPDEAVGPLAGVTFSVKANIDVAGAATTHGLKSLTGNVKSSDAPIVARLRAAGATPIGHANMPTLNARGMHTYSELAGHTINPWGASKSPGGDRYPVLIGPVSTIPSFEPDQDRRSPEALAEYFEAMKLCEATSFAGLPSR